MFLRVLVLRVFLTSLMFPNSVYVNIWLTVVIPLLAMKASGKMPLEGYKNPLKIYVGGVYASLKGEIMNNFLRKSQWNPHYTYVTRE